MGVAESVSTSTDVRSCFTRSLWVTPKRCSSSTTRRPRRLKCTSFERSRCVPMTTSTEPCLRPASDVARVGLRGEARERSNDEAGRGTCAARSRGSVAAQHRRRAEDGDLPAFARDPEPAGTKSDFGLAEANVAAHEPIHRRGVDLEVALDVADRDRLIGRLVERKRRFESSVVVGRRGERHTARGLSLRVELEELVGHLADVAHRALLRLLEVRLSRRADRASAWTRSQRASRFG